MLIFLISHFHFLLWTCSVTFCGENEEMKNSYFPVMYDEECVLFFRKVQKSMQYFSPFLVSYFV
jgi:hypothetical protein